MEEPLPPLMKIDDDVEGVEVVVVLALKSMRRSRNCEERVCEVGRLEREDVGGVSVEDARDCSRFDGLGRSVFYPREISTPTQKRNPGRGSNPGPVA